MTSRNISFSDSVDDSNDLPPGEESTESLVFHSFGVLEYILSFADTNDLVATTAVSRRWKQAGRRDEIWQDVIRRTWKDKKGVCSDTNMIFWRSLFNNCRVRAMDQKQALCMFQHPLSYQKYKVMKEEIAKQESDFGQVDPEYLQRFMQMHMLDLMSESGDDDHYHRRIFFSDLYFGSYASSIMDSRRSSISRQELCTPFGFDMYFKIEEEDADDVIAETNEQLQRYDEAEGILLYRHSTCYFCQDQDFRIVLLPNVAPTYRPTDLRWRWIETGKQIQVGPYPSLTVSRRKDWGWKLENLHVVMYSQHGSWPPPQLDMGDDGDDIDDSDSSSVDSLEASSILDEEED